MSDLKTSSEIPKDNSATHSICSLLSWNKPELQLCGKLPVGLMALCSLQAAQTNIWDHSRNKHILLSLNFAEESHGPSKHYWENSHSVPDANALDTSDRSPTLHHAKQLFVACILALHGFVDLKHLQRKQNLIYLSKAKRFKYYLSHFVSSSHVLFPMSDIFQVHWSHLLLSTRGMAPEIRLSQNAASLSKHSLLGKSQAKPPTTSFLLLGQESTLVRPWYSTTTHIMSTRRSEKESSLWGSNCDFPHNQRPVLTFLQTDAGPVTPFLYLISGSFRIQ